MPPKKNSKDEFVQKQKIAARLIEISIKVDDYIYKKIPISADDARKYGEEVALLEPECQDVRSQQVIEKLTRFMKSIVEDQCNINLENTSQFSYNVRDVDSNYPSTLDSAIKSMLRSTQVQANELCDITELSHALKKDNKEDYFGKSNITDTEPLIKTNEAEVDLERTLSNLSISIIDPINNEIGVTFDKVPTVRESLNVTDTQYLYNSASMNPIQQMVIPCFSNPILGYKHDDQIFSTVDTVQCNKSNKVQNNTKEQTSLMISQNNDMIMDVQENPRTSFSNVSMLRNISNLEPHKEANIEHAFNIGASDKSNKPNMENKKTRTNKNKRNHGLKNVQKNNEKISKEKASNSKMKPKRVYAKRKNKVINTENNLLTENITQNKKNKGRRKNRKETAFDLSWVENIKFVRVIDPLEYDCSLNNLEDSFWNNTSLPSGCNDYF